MEDSVHGPDGEVFGSISCGADTTCGVDGNGGITCWGIYQELFAPSRGATYSDVALGGVGTCALSSEGEIECWISDEFGTPPR